MLALRFRGARRFGAISAPGGIDQRDRNACSQGVVFCVPELAVMSAKQGLLGLVDASRKVRRPPLVGMQFLHERSVRTPDFVNSRSLLQAKDLIGLLRRHFAARRLSALPPCPFALRVLTPTGKPAVEVTFK